MDQRIEWVPWGEKAFERSERERKPILLSIGATWCHWCHVMDEGTYRDPEVIRMVNGTFIPVRVDTDRRPEINRRYNQGGWPSTAFLAADGRLLTGATYLPPEHFKSLAEEVSGFYRDHYGDTTAPGGKPGGDGNGAEAVMTEPRVTEPVMTGRAVTESGEALGRGRAMDEPVIAAPVVEQERLAGMVAGIGKVLMKSFDAKNGGFGGAPKFPLPDVIRFCREMVDLGAPGVFKDILSRTLVTMGEGEIFDRVEGGFFRYATRRDWREPHYEKLAPDNALLAREYLEAWLLTGRGEFRDTARQVWDYLVTAFWDQDQGWFRASQDADQEYYRLGREDRERRAAPRIDPSPYTDWNAMLASSLLRGALVLGEENWLGIARRVMDGTLLSTGRREGRMPHLLGAGEKGLPTGKEAAAREVERAGPFLLGDQVWTAQASLDFFEAFGDPDYLDQALFLIDLCLERFWDPSVSAFSDLSRGEKFSPGPMSVPIYPPEENARVIDTLLTVWEITGEDRYRVVAAGALNSIAEEGGPGLLEASLGSAATRYLWPPVKLLYHPGADGKQPGRRQDDGNRVRKGGTRVGDGSERAGELGSAILRLPSRRRFLVHAGPAEDSGSAGTAGAEFKAMVEEARKTMGDPGCELAFPCGAGRCLAPAFGSREASEAVDSLWELQSRQALEILASVKTGIAPEANE